MAMTDRFAAQLYTVREELKKDFPGVLRELHRMGWPAVQISGLHGHDPGEIAAVMKECGLKTAGMHVPWARLRDELDGVAADARLFGTRDVVCPSLPDEFRTPDGYVLARGALNDIARRLAPQGMRLSYHNHAFELAAFVNGRSALEYLLAPEPDNALLAEVDVFWVKKGGGDPLKFIRPYAGRMPIIHLKDMTADERATFAEIGTGVIEFLPILRWCELSGVEWYAVEQDSCPGDPLASLSVSLDNLRALARQIESAR